MLTLYAIGGVALVVLVGGLAFLLRRREPTPEPWRPRNSQPWDKKPEETSEAGTRLASIPPPAGIPVMASQEADAVHLESTELYIEDDEEPTGPIPKILLRAAGRTDAGKKREHNEDAFLLAPEHELYVIADGMGGYAAGEVAAQLTVETLEERFASGDHEVLDEGVPRRGAELMSAIQEANHRVRAAAKMDPSKKGMGTTVVAARFSPGRNRVYVAHVGDSRCYRLRDGELRQLTTDHTLGALGLSGPSANKLSRAVGAFDQLDVDLTVDEPRIGDQYVLCSDGLYKMIDDRTIADLLEGGASADDAADALVAAALERGGRDNVTVVVVRVADPELHLRESGEHRISG